jgi:hypothetical protein
MLQTIHAPSNVPVLMGLLSVVCPPLRMLHLGRKSLLTTLAARLLNNIAYRQELAERRRFAILVMLLNLDIGIPLT